MWIVYALLAAALWGVGYVLNEQILKHVNVSQFMFVSALLMVLLWCVYFGVTGKDMGLVKVFTSGPEVWGLMLLVTAVYFIGSFAIYTSIQQSNATLAAMIETSYPVFTFLFAWLLLDKVQLTPLTLLGGLTVLAGICLIYLGTKPSANAETASMEEPLVIMPMLASNPFFSHHYEHETVTLALEIHDKTLSIGGLKAAKPGGKKV